MGAAVDDVHHGRGEDGGVDAAEVAVEREAEGFGGGAGDGHGDGEDGVGAEVALVGGAVDGDHGGVDESLVGAVHAGELGGEDGLDVFDGFEDAFAEVDGLVSVAELDGLVLAGGGTGGDGGAAADAAFEDDVGLYGGVAAGVEDFACVDRDDLGHGAPVLCLGAGGGGEGDVVVEAVLEFGAAIDGDGVAGSVGDGVDQFDRGFAHQTDFSKGLGRVGLGWVGGREVSVGVDSLPEERRARGCGAA